MSDMIIFLPPIEPTPPETCPYCGKVLPAKKSGTKAFVTMVISVVLGVLVFIWIMVTLTDWTNPYGWDHPPTLVEVIQAQWRGLAQLFKRIV